eukprot:3536021-Ditylum_brightwellii.AAC.1
MSLSLHHGATTSLSAAAATIFGSNPSKSTNGAENLQRRLSPSKQCHSRVSQSHQKHSFSGEGGGRDAGTSMV